MKISVIKRITKLFSRNHKQERGYQIGEFKLRGVAGDPGFYQQKKKWQLLKIKQLVATKKRKKNEGYGRSVTRGKLLPRSGAFILVVSMTGLIVLAGGRTWIEKELGSIAFFQVNELIISGCRVTSREQLREDAKIFFHQTSLIGMEKAEIERRLEENPWIARAKVNLNWPSTIEIEIKEHVPVALLHSTISGPDQLYYIDKKGFSFTPVPVGANVDFPVITGLAGIKDENLRQNAFGEALIFLKKVSRNDPHLPTQSVSEVHVNPAGELVVYLVEHPFPIFFGSGNTKQKYSRLLKVLQALYKKKSGQEIISSVEYIRMDYFDDKVLVAQSGS